MYNNQFGLEMRVVVVCMWIAILSAAQLNSQEAQWRGSERNGVYRENWEQLSP